MIDFRKEAADLVHAWWRKGIGDLTFARKADLAACIVLALEKARADGFAAGKGAAASG